MSISTHRIVVTLRWLLRVRHVELWTNCFVGKYRSELIEDNRLKGKQASGDSNNWEYPNIAAYMTPTPIPLSPESWLSRTGDQRKKLRSVNVEAKSE